MSNCRADGALDADLDVVEVDEDGDAESCLVEVSVNPLSWRVGIRPNGVMPDQNGRDASRELKGGGGRKASRSNCSYNDLISGVSDSCRLTSTIAHRLAQWLERGNRSVNRQPSLQNSVSQSAPSNTGFTSWSPYATRVNWPRCSSSRPFPPRPVTSYLAVLIVCSAPRLVSTRHEVAIAVRRDEADHAVLVFGAA